MKGIVARLKNDISSYDDSIKWKRSMLEDLKSKFELDSKSLIDNIKEYEDFKKETQDAINVLEATVNTELYKAVHGETE